MKKGLILEPYKPRDYIFGGVTGITGEVLQENGDWTSYLPLKEYQSGLTETMGCVSFSCNNVLETIYKKKFKEETNYSDRFLAKLSGTTKNGNTFTQVADTVRKQGLVLEDKWSWNRETFNWDEFYLSIPTELLQEANEWRIQYEVKYEWVIPTIDNLKEALRYSPLQIGVYAWGEKKDDIYLRTDKQQNHAVVLFGYEDENYWKIYDTYDEVIKYLAWDFSFTGALKFNLELKKPMPDIPNNTLLQEVETSGTFGLYISNKIYIDEEGKLIATWLMRNKGDVKDKVQVVSLKTWDSIPHYNLKNQLI